MSIFFFFKTGEQKGKICSVWEVGASGKGENIRKRYRRVNMLEILCVHVCKWKNETC
jgi:hypothetical protein